MFEISVKDLSEKLARGENLYLLDVRLPWEHELARLPDHALVSLQELAGALDRVKPPEGAQVVCYCHHGVRSLRAAAILEQAGFKNVASLAGGIEAWSTQVDPKIPRY